MTITGVLFLLALVQQVDGSPCTWLNPSIATGPAEIRGYTATLLSDTRGAERLAAARALGRSTALRARDEGGPAPRVPGDKDPRDALTIALADPSREVRMAAACALGRHGDVRALVPLERRRDSSDVRLREVIDNSLARIRARAPAPLLLRGATVIDGTGAEPRAHTSVLVEGDVITRVGPDSILLPSPGTRIVDLSGRWITPGLWDMHVHTGKLGRESLPLLVAAGVTSVRDMGSVFDSVIAWRRAIAKGELIGPAILAAGPMLEAPATLERFAGKQTTEPWTLTRVAVSDPSRAKIIVDSIADLGVDFIKVRETVDTATYVAIAHAARRRGIALAGHAPFGLPVPRGARLGVMTFEHASYPYPLDTVRAQRTATLKAFREGGTAVVPTIVAWATELMHPDSLALLIHDSAGVRDPRRRLIEPETVREWSFELAEMKPLSAASLRGWCGFINRTLADLATMHDAGIPILPGTDLGLPALFPGWSLHDELGMLVNGGVMTPAEALRAASFHAARHAGVADRVGTVQPGMSADLLILQSDPSVDVAALTRIESVVLDGVIVGAAQLAELRRRIPLTIESGIELHPGAAGSGCPPFSPAGVAGSRM